MNGNNHQMEGIPQFCRREIFHRHKLSRNDLQWLANTTKWCDSAGGN